jgi:hypothetical protein
MNFNAVDAVAPQNGDPALPVARLPL